MNKAEWLLTVALQYSGNACLLWPWSLHWKGYGQVRYKGTCRRAHRVVCEAAHGPAPSRRHQAAHSCNNRKCVNKRHLRWATPAENSADMVAAGNSTRGERSVQAKLKPAQVHVIRRSKAKQDVLAARYGVSQSVISMIKAGKRWAHV